MKNRLKIAILFLLTAGFGSVFAQNASNVQVEFSCTTGKTTVTYDLTTSCPTTATLYYSTDTITWLPAQTVTGDLTAQFAGTGKTIVWDNTTDNVQYGQFYFKVDAEDCNCSADDCVMIGGVCWATRNVDMPGTFTVNPEDYGMFYQWNRNIGWSATNPLINSNGGNVWDISNPAGTTWEADNDPCPCGWRVPTFAELLNLMFVGSQWTTLNGVNGRIFGSGINTIFLPAAGWREHDAVGTLLTVGFVGDYWSGTGTQYNGIACGLHFYSGAVDVSAVYNSYYNFGKSVRCVAE